MKRPAYHVYFATRSYLGERMIHWWGETPATRYASGEGERMHSVDLPFWYRWANVWKVEAKITEVTGYRRR